MIFNYSLSLLFIGFIYHSKNVIIHTNFKQVTLIVKLFDYSNKNRIFEWLYISASII